MVVLWNCVFVCMFSSSSCESIPGGEFGSLVLWISMPSSNRVLILMYSCCSAMLLPPWLFVLCTRRPSWSTIRSRASRKHSLSFWVGAVACLRIDDAALLSTISAGSVNPKPSPIDSGMKTSELRRPVLAGRCVRPVDFIAAAVIAAMSLSSVCLVGGIDCSL